jgi:hypothetical protein
LKATGVIAKGLLLMCLLTMILGRPDVGAAKIHGFQVLPNELNVSETFQGEEIKISAEVPAGSNAIVEFRGTSHEDRLLRKGRRGGLWMNVGEVKVNNAPSLYLVMSTDAALLSSRNSESQWGYQALQKQMEFSGAIPKAGKDKLFKDFLKLKESQGLYGSFPGALKVAPTSGGHARVEGQFWLSDKIPPANYEIHFFVINNGKVVDEKTTAFPVAMQGMPAVLTALAFDHATVYGLLAVTIAILAGFIMGFVFKGKGAH